jgi:hypothetical protein
VDYKNSTIFLGANSSQELSEASQFAFRINKCRSTLEKELFDDCLEVTKEFNCF